MITRKCQSCPCTPVSDVSSLYSFTRQPRVTHVRCQRSKRVPHPLHAPAFQHPAPDIPHPPRWQTVYRPECSTRRISDGQHTRPTCKSATLYDATTYTQFATWAAQTIRFPSPLRGCSKRMKHSFKALATNEHKCAAA
ncbi:hypothetical protein PCAR4_680061 [Paraburkholderia caribensis]|nr:hypothetical protein PCAR4_680061 [Paraburkholderia caribensis]